VKRFAWMLLRRDPVHTAHRVPGPVGRRRILFRAALGASVVTVVGVLAVTAAVVAYPNVARVVAGTDGSNAPAGDAEPSKPFVSAAPDGSPSVASSAPCAPGAVDAWLMGWGGGMGTQYMLIRLDPTGASCSLPRTPAVTVTDDAGTALASASGRVENPRVDLTSAALEARLGVGSLCGLAANHSAVAVLDFGDQDVARVPLPAAFRQGCSGSVSRVWVDELAPVTVPPAEPVSRSSPSREAAAALKACGATGGRIANVAGMGHIPAARLAADYVELWGVEPELQSDDPAWIIAFKGRVDLGRGYWADDPICVVVDGHATTFAPSTSGRGDRTETAPPPPSRTRTGLPALLP
jgi:hypothetical protein